MVFWESVNGPFLTVDTQDVRGTLARVEEILPRRSISGKNIVALYFVEVNANNEQ